METNSNKNNNFFIRHINVFMQLWTALLVWYGLYNLYFFNSVPAWYIWIISIFSIIGLSKMIFDVI